VIDNGVTGRLVWIGERKMKATAFIASALLAFSGLSGAEITFYKIYESDIGGAGAGDIVEVPDGGYAILSCNWSWTFLRTDSVGNVLAQHCNVFGYRMCLVNDGELAVLNTNLNDSLLIHWTDQMGVLNRSRSYYTTGYNWPSPSGIIETMDGGYAIGARLQEVGPQGILLRIDDQENLQWTALFDTQHPYCLTETPDTGFVIGGSYSGDGFLTWVDADGNEEQTLLFGDETINGITQTSAGYAISRGSGGVAGIDYTGNILWSYTPEIVYFADICLTDNGDVVAVGYNWSEEYSGLTRLNPEDGSLVWERTYPDCVLYRMTATADGGFAMAGIRPGSPYDDIILIKTDSEGLCPEMGIEEGVTPAGLLNLLVYPNPCSGSASVSFTLSEPAVVQLSVYDLSGRQVMSIESGTIAAGELTTSWDPASVIPNGCYLIVLDTSWERVIRRAVLLR